MYIPTLHVAMNNTPAYFLTLVISNDLAMDDVIMFKGQPALE